VGNVAGLIWENRWYSLAGFTPVVIKIVIVSGNLLRYNRLLGFPYLGRLVVPAAMTFLFIKQLQVLRDSQYAVIGESSGLGIKAIAEKDNHKGRDKFKHVMRVRTGIFVSLLARSRSFLYVHEASLVGSQFLVVFLALSMRQRLNMTAGAALHTSAIRIDRCRLNSAACVKVRLR
jgi:hypothetical protein